MVNISVESGPRRSAAGRHAGGFFLVSGLLHLAALAALAQHFEFANSAWRIRFDRGRNSVELAASMPSAIRAAEPVYKLAPNEPTATTNLPEAESYEVPIERVEASLPGPPTMTVALLGTEASAKPLNDLVRRAAVQDATHPPVIVNLPRRPMTVAELDPPAVRLDVDSVASSPSAADSGAATLDPPALVHMVPPYYPQAWWSVGEIGTTKVRLFVDAAGRVFQVKLEESSGFRRLDRSALAAASRWRFEPPVRGQPVNFVKPIRFKPPVRQ